MPQSGAADWDGLSAAELTARLGLTAGPDGLAQHVDAAQPQVKTVLFDVGDMLDWQKIDAPLQIDFLAGAPLAVSWSADGHDAEAAHLGHDGGAALRPAQSIAAQSWLTAESLGRWSLIQLTADRPWAEIGTEAAPAGWFPQPRPAAG